MLIKNICLKIKVKLGGINYEISERDKFFQMYLQKSYDGPLMIISANINYGIRASTGRVNESMAAVCILNTFKTISHSKRIHNLPY